jgi:hypothetical protein
MLAGLILGMAGATADFSSGYLILSQGMMTANDMGTIITAINWYAVAWGAGLYVLSGLLVVSALASTSELGDRRMNDFALVMIVYGALMFGIGSLMYFGRTPMMQGSSLSGVAMFAVGALMVVNGAFKFRSSRMTGSMSRTEVAN